MEHYVLSAPSSDSGCNADLPSAGRETGCLERSYGSCQRKGCQGRSPVGPTRYRSTPWKDCRFDRFARGVTPPIRPGPPDKASVVIPSSLDGENGCSEDLRGVMIASESDVLGVDKSLGPYGPRVGTETTVSDLTYSFRSSTSGGTGRREIGERPNDCQDSVNMRHRGQTHDSRDDQVAKTKVWLGLGT